jgi:hypothetical protein
MIFILQSACFSNQQAEENGKLFFLSVRAISAKILNKDDFVLGNESPQDPVCPPSHWGSTTVLLCNGRQL